METAITRTTSFPSFGEPRIVVHSKYLGDGQPVFYDFEWQGDIHKSVSITREVLVHSLIGNPEYRTRDPKPGDKITVFPWTLRVVGYDLANDIVTCMREEGFWITEVVLYRLKHLFRLVKARIIRTLAVWNLAHVPEGQIPAWVHVHFHRCPRCDQ